MHHHDIGFSDTVSNVVEIVKEEHRRGRPYGPFGNRYTRGRNHTYSFLYNFNILLMLCVESSTCFLFMI